MVSTLTINDDKEIYLGAPKNLKKKKLNIHYCNALVRRVTKISTMTGKSIWALHKLHKV